MLESVRSATRRTLARPGAREAVVVAFVLLVAFLFRSWHLTATGWMPGEGPRVFLVQHSYKSIFHYADSATYLRDAHGLLARDGSVFPIQPPFTLFVLAATLKLLGRDFPAIKLAQALLGSLSLGFVYYTTRRVFGKTEGYLALLFCSVSFSLIMITGALNSEVIYLATLSGSLALLVALDGKTDAGARSLGVAFAFGLAAGAALLTRAEFALILAAAFAFLALRRARPVHARVALGLAAALGVAIALTPWTVRNYGFMQRLQEQHPNARLPSIVPISLNGPINFAVGHNPDATGGFSPSLSGSSEQLIPNFGALENPANDGYRLGWEFIKRHPRTELSRIPPKLSIYARGFSNGFFLDNFPAGRDGATANLADSFVARSRRWLPIGTALFALGFVVLVRLRDAGPIRFLPLVPLAAVLITSLAFFATSRFVLPALPFFFVVVAVGLAPGVRRLLGTGPALEIAVTAVAALFFAIGWMQSREVSVFTARGETSTGTAAEVRYHHAAPWDSVPRRGR